MNTQVLLADAFNEYSEEIKKANDGQIVIDQNEVRIAVKDKEHIVVDYDTPTSINTKYWY